MQYSPSSTVSGGWVNKLELRNGQKCVIVSEATPVVSKFKDEKTGEPLMQDTAKVHFEGQKEPVNCNLNKPTINALIAAFGTESLDWMNQPLTVELEKVRIGGKSSLALYLIPSGFKKMDDDNGFAVIVKTGKTTLKSDTDRVNEDLNSEREAELGDAPEL